MTECWQASGLPKMLHRGQRLHTFGGVICKCQSLAAIREKLISGLHSNEAIAARPRACDSRSVPTVAAVLLGLSPRPPTSVLSSPLRRGPCQAGYHPRGETQVHTGRVSKGVRLCIWELCDGLRASVFPSLKWGQEEEEEEEMSSTDTPVASPTVCLGWAPRWVSEVIKESDPSVVRVRLVGARTQ